ncbi:hypothetical protein EYF80_029230 [Liparis tanakae]|uniref:Uncharacterized protein n=1 Tax=Liparis tanakae TaxID=230148 RepID=A0A4Z2H3R5_9TELE|nr:hypothetical protein EYF80_029230 [Liparis tanakae]
MLHARSSSLSYRRGLSKKYPLEERTWLGIPAALCGDRLTVGGHLTPARRTDPFLRRPADPEEEDDQRGGQQLPDEQDHPEHDVAAVAQRRAQVRLETTDIGTASPGGARESERQTDSETAQSTNRLSLMVTLTRTMVFTSAAVILTSRAQTRFTTRKRRLTPKKTRYRGSLWGEMHRQ